MMTNVDIVFSGNFAEGLQFVEVEGESGEEGSIRFGKWVYREDGFWVLRLFLCGECRNTVYDKDTMIVEGLNMKGDTP